MFFIATYIYLLGSIETWIASLFTTVISNDIYKCRKYKFELEQLQDLFFFSQLSLSLLSFFSVLIFFLLATSDWAMAVERSFSWCC